MMMETAMVVGFAVVAVVVLCWWGWQYGLGCGRFSRDLLLRRVVGAEKDAVFRFLSDPTNLKMFHPYTTEIRMKSERKEEGGAVTVKNFDWVEKVPFTVVSAARMRCDPTSFAISIDVAPQNCLHTVHINWCLQNAREAEPPFTDDKKKTPHEDLALSPVPHTEDTVDLDDTTATTSTLEPDNGKTKTTATTTNITTTKTTATKTKAKITSETTHSHSATTATITPTATTATHVKTVSSSSEEDYDLRRRGRGGEGGEREWRERGEGREGGGEGLGGATGGRGTGGGTRRRSRDREAPDCGSTEFLNHVEVLGPTPWAPVVCMVIRILQGISDSIMDNVQRHFEHEHPSHSGSGASGGGGGGGDGD